MSVLSAQELIALGDQIIRPFHTDNVTPQGYDFSIGHVYSMSGLGKLMVDNGGRMLPHYDELVPGAIMHTHDGPLRGWFLKSGVYLIDLVERVIIPADVMGIMHPRSSLLRMGATLHTAIWDAGYNGVSKTILHVLNPFGIDIEQGARIGHMTFHRLSTASTQPYAGVYQGEGKT